jgi:hypothetical protein
MMLDKAPTRQKIKAEQIAVQASKMFGFERNKAV